MRLSFFKDPKQSQGASPPSSKASLTSTDNIDYDKTGDSFADALDQFESAETAGGASRYG
jgi:hypothetical protein